MIISMTTARIVDVILELVVPFLEFYTTDAVTNCYEIMTNLMIYN
jgi:hypothetical protein